MEPTDRRLRRHVAGTAAIAAGFVLALLVLVVVNAGDPAAPPSPSMSAAPVVVPQETLLVQVTLERTRAASLLTATGGDPDRAVLVSLRSDLLLSNGASYTPLLDANLSLNRRLTAQAAGNTLGIRVDGGWRMERKALAGMVDSVGGVEVAVEAATVFYDDLEQPQLRLPAGTSKLSGPEASWYVMGTIVGEDEVLGVQDRFAEVFVKAVQQLPPDHDAVAAMLTSLGSLSDPLQGVSDVTEQLLELRADFLAGETLPIELPMRASTAADPVATRQQIEGGPAVAVGSFQVTEYEAATPTLRDAFRAAPRVPGVDGDPRVLVWNATGEPRASEAAILEITDAGFVALSAGQWPSVQPVTSIHGIGYSEEGESYTDAVAEALRLPAPDQSGDTGTLSPTPAPGAVSVPPSASSAPTMPPQDQKPWADVDVVFGQDYQPCPPTEPNCLEQELP